jgi:hypothetical protein
MPTLGNRRFIPDPLVFQDTAKRERIDNFATAKIITQPIEGENSA